MKDIGASLEFYKQLGVDVPEKWEGPYADAMLEGGIRISWNDAEMMKSIEKNFIEPVGQRIGLAFLCDSPPAVDAKFRELTEMGYRGDSEPHDAFWGQRYARICDPDGNVVDLFAPLPTLDSEPQTFI